jgi:ADP-ribose pyrophosphatase YjhB (NUDIX family)
VRWLSIGGSGRVYSAIVITFESNSVRFHFRTAGVAIDDGHVLVQRCEHDDFWALPGGRVEVAESASDALAREMLEEIDARVEIGRLLWIVENFFEYEGVRAHELGLYFAMTMPQSLRRAATGPEFDGHEPGLRLIFRWQPLALLDEVVIKPSFLQSALAAPPATPAHVVHVDDASIITAS